MTRAPQVLQMGEGPNPSRSSHPASNHGGMMNNASGLVARCPTCLRVADHDADGDYYRCGSCGRAHDLMAELA